MWPVSNLVPVSETDKPNWYAVKSYWPNYILKPFALRVVFEDVRHNTFRVVSNLCNKS